MASSFHALSVAVEMTQAVFVETESSVENWREAIDVLFFLLAVNVSVISLLALIFSHLVCEMPLHFLSETHARVGKKEKKGNRKKRKKKSKKRKDKNKNKAGPEQRERQE